MKMRKLIALGTAGSMLAAAALAEAPADERIMEEIVVTARYPSHLLIEENIATTAHSAALVAAGTQAESPDREITLASGLTDKIGFKPEIRLNL